VKKKIIKIQILKLISRFRKIDYIESGGRNNWENSKKLYKIWEGKNVNLSEFWSTRIWIGNFQTSRNFRKCQSAMP
jgi:hypothetical protein